MEIKKQIVKTGSSFGIILDRVILDKLGLKEKDFVLIDVKRKIIDPALIEKGMPVAVRIRTAFRTFDCWVIGDAGSWLYTIHTGRDYDGRELKDVRAFNMYDKSNIQEIQFLKKIPFELNSRSHLDIRRAQSQFPNQWKIKIPRPGSNPEIKKEFFKKINQISEEKKIEDSNPKNKTGENK